MSAEASRAHHKPIVQANEDFAWMVGDIDPAQKALAARQSAWALLHRVRAHPDPEVVERVLRLADDEGIEAIAELWAEAHAISLPGILWRLYLLREVVTTNAEHASELFRVGLRESQYLDMVIAGVTEPIDPVSLRELTDKVMRGVFVGDFAVALERAASACRVFAAGATRMADEVDNTSPADATRLTTQALRFADMARELGLGATAWRSGTQSQYL